MGIHKNIVLKILSLLHEIGMLEGESGFSGKLQSKARANDLTTSLYEMLLLPAEETARNLTPANGRAMTPDLARWLLVNYSEERTFIGHQGGEEVRGVILQLLSEHGGMKFSHIVEEGNRRLDGRELKDVSWSYHIKILEKMELVENVGRGVYRRKMENVLS